MLDDIRDVAQLQFIRNQRIEMIKKEAELSTPLLKDTKYISLMFKWYCELSHCDSKNAEELKADQKREFIFITLFFYSPIALVGGKMVNKVREALAELFNYDTGSSISYLRNDILFSYNKFEEPRKQIDYFYFEILNRLKEEGIVS